MIQSNLVVSPNTLLFEIDQKSPSFGKLTRDGFLLIQALTQAINSATSGYVLIDGIQTITNKTMDGDANTFVDIGTGSLKSKTGNGTKVVTASAAGTNGSTAQWDASGNLVTGLIPGDYTPTSGLVTLLIEDAINNGEVTKAPTENAVFDALALKQTAGASITLASFTVATLPSASPAAKLIYVSDESGGPVPAFSDNTNWLRVTDRAIVS